MVREDFLQTRDAPTGNYPGYIQHTDDPEIPVEDQEPVIESEYHHVQTGCLYKVFLVLCIYYSVNVIFQIVGTVFGAYGFNTSNLAYAIFFFLLYKGYKTLTVRDNDISLNMEWGPWFLAKYFCKCCQTDCNNQRLHLYYDDIEYYTIDDSPDMKCTYCYGIRDCPSYCFCFAKLLSFNNAICCCSKRIKNYVAFNFKVKDDYKTYHCLKNCCRKKTNIALVTDDKEKLHQFLLNKGLIYDNGEQDLCINQPKPVPVNVEMENAQTVEI